MRLVTKLEKRFNVALETLELDASTGVDNGEIEALLNQISDLKISQTEKDATVATLTAQVADLEKTRTAAAEKDADIKTAQAESEAKVAALTSQLTELRKQNEAAAIRISGLKDTAASAREESAKNLAAIAAAQAAETAAVNKIAKLKGNLEEAVADTSGSAEAFAKMEDLEDEVEGLKARLNVAEANALNHYEKMRRLRGAHRAVRASLKGNVLNADEVNAAMEAELEALQMQREIDLNEVNIVLEKLTPLVEGK